MAGPTIPQTQTILESYFQTGSTPNQNQFTELIGTMFYLYNAMIDLANTVNDNVETLQAQIAAACPAVVCQIAFSLAGFGDPLVPALLGLNTGVSGVAINPDNNYCTVTFSAAFANTNYKAMILQYSSIELETSGGGGIAGPVMEVLPPITQNEGSIVFQALGPNITVILWT